MSPTTQRLGILGGTFDPIHLGHLIVAAELRAALDLDRVILVPNARSPFKGGHHISPAADRLAMLRLATAQTPWLEISTVELERGEISYTVDTLVALKDQFADTTLVFLMGADSLADLPRWHRPTDILTLAEIGVASRPGVQPDLDPIVSTLPAAAGRIHVVPTPQIGISATDIRHRVRDGRPITFHVPPDVERYIGSHRLYSV